MNIVLCGMMGVGKTSVGVKISELTHRRWFDTDDMISARYGKIADLFEYYGEAYFRSLETEAVRELSTEDHLVISTGGGLVLKEENARLLKENGKIVFLRATLSTLLSRVSGDERPLLRGGNLQERLVKLIDVRTPVYTAVADLIVDTDGKTVEEVAREVIALSEGK